LTSQIRTGTGTDESAASLFSVGWTGGVNNSQTNTVTTTMTRYTQTVTLGSTVNQIMLLFTYTPTGTAGANEWFQIEGVQIEVGNQVSPFIRAGGGTIQAELSACQRYYYRVKGDEGSSGTTNSLGLGTFYNATVFRSPIRFPVKMRRIPDFTSANSAAYFLIAANGSVPTYASVTLDNGSVDAALLNVAVTGATGGQSGWLQTNNASSFIDFSAEL
jgi:hypothetical protein